MPSSGSPQPRLCCHVTLVSRPLVAWRIQSWKSPTCGHFQRTPVTGGGFGLEALSLPSEVHLEPCACAAWRGPGVWVSRVPRGGSGFSCTKHKPWLLSLVVVPAGHGPVPTSCPRAGCRRGLLTPYGLSHGAGIGECPPLAPFLPGLVPQSMTLGRAPGCIWRSDRGEGHSGRPHGCTRVFRMP